MRRAKQRAEAPTPSEPVREEVEEDNTDEKNGFFACYLLCSLCPRYKGHTYIGFTVNPRRRIRQHNGEIRCGAWRTKHKRPWEMILCIYGFPSNVSALQFEWAWQHPKESLAVRKAAASFRSLSGIENKIKLAYTMLTLPQWERLNLTVNFFSTKYVKHSAHCPKLPKHMRINVQAMDELPCYTDNNLSDDDDDGDDDGDNKSDRDKDELPHYKGVEISNDDTSTYENSCQRGGELHDSLYGERGNNDFTLYDSYGYIRHSKLMDEAKRTTDCRTPQSNGISHGDDVLRQDGDNLKQHVDPQDSSHLIVSPMHSTKEKPATSNNINLFSCSKELFECVNSCNLVQLKELSTPRTVKYGLSYDSASVSSECNIIDLSTPFIPCSRKRQQSSICVEIIDLIDSPI